MMITAHGGAIMTGRNSRLYLNNIDVYSSDAIEVDIYKKKDILYISHLPAPFSYKKKIRLHEVFEIVKQKDIKVNCDIKMNGIIKDVIDLAKEIGVENNLIFTGKVKESDKDLLDCGQAWFNKLEGLSFTFKNVQAIKDRIDSFHNEHMYGINVNQRLVTKDFVLECKRVGVNVSMFTVDSIMDLNKWVPLVNGNITTNQPNTAIAIMNICKKK